jgi:hypothetical protein
MAPWQDVFIDHTGTGAELWRFILTNVRAMGVHFFEREWTRRQFEMAVSGAANDESVISAVRLTPPLAHSLPRPLPRRGCWLLVCGWSGQDFAKSYDARPHATATSEPSTSVTL